MGAVGAVGAVGPVGAVGAVGQKAEGQSTGTLVTWDRSLQHICICRALNDSPRLLPGTGAIFTPGQYTPLCSVAYFISLFSPFYF